MITYDVAIVGSGIACSLTLCRLAECLNKRPGRGKMLHIAVIEKEGERWSGIPYGSRSSIGALTFQKLQEFLDEPERGNYIDWLKRNAESWLGTLCACGGESAAQWIADNQALMDADRWEELYLPRFLFGSYVFDCTAHALQELSQKGIATLTIIHGEAVEASRAPGETHALLVREASGTRTQVRATRVVLAIGSPPQQCMQKTHAGGEMGHTHIYDVYSPSEDTTLRRIRQTLDALAAGAKANILIVGSNASALEVLYLIRYRPEIRDRIRAVVVLSRSGKLPYKISGEVVPFEFSALQALCASNHFHASDVMHAIQADIARAEQDELNVADLCDVVGAAVNRAVELLDRDEQKRFVCEYGVHYSRLMRRAGRDTRNAVDELIRSGVLTTVKGDFRRLEPCPLGEGLAFAAYCSNGGDVDRIHPVPFSITINCGGFEDLSSSSSPFIRSLIASGLCSVNSTRRGFSVTERLEASENFYVIGPLVAGNFNDRFRLWHVESASRIAGLARLLAESLFHSLETSYTESAETMLLLQRDDDQLHSPAL